MPSRTVTPWTPMALTGWVDVAQVEAAQEGDQEAPEVAWVDSQAVLDRGISRNAGSEAANLESLLQVIRWIRKTLSRSRRNTETAS